MNMKLRKLFAVLLAGAMSLSLLAGCGSGDTPPAASQGGTPDSSQAPEGSTPPEGGTEIVWAGWSGEEEASKAIFQRMMETYEKASGNSVTWVGWTWADTAQQLLIRTQGKEQLDLAQTDIGIFNTVAAAGVLADWNDILGKDFMDATFEQSALSVGSIDGKQLGMPWSMASITMVYNPEILSAAGWDKVPATIAEFEQCLADIKAADPDVVPYAVSTKDATCAGDFMPWLWTFGGAIFNEDGSVALNSEAAVACVQWYQGLMEKGCIAMDTGRGEARQLFAQGKVAFYDDAVVAKGQAVNNGVAPEDVVNVCSAMPRPVLKQGDAPQSTMWGHMLVAFKDSAHQAEAAELAKTLISDEVALDYFENNGMPPVTKSAAGLDQVKNDAYLNGFLSSTATARLEETARMTNASEIKTVITEELQYALLGQKTAEQCVADMAARLEAL
ncbi:MAG: sugar ABC transporter substrate-binding protein [Oscillospiraceae bacterium]|nr:sugar ABC transporter substrate-binding protein [Oscillospiraceae bacterium]MCI9308844.1 sugar ABC transporter substrate-binding protein [Oscillospiraceae bacterium]MCI9549710.1 sugar ABC transporter substrate-binding protein [Oscillospiraceae bacterium]